MRAEEQKFFYLIKSSILIYMSGEIALALEQEKLEQLTMDARSAPVFLDRRTALRQAIEEGKNFIFSPTESKIMSVEQSGLHLAPKTALELLKQTPDFDRMPESLEKTIALRTKAQAVAQQIMEVNSLETIPTLAMFLNGINLDKVNQSELVTDAITEKIALLGFYKIIELMTQLGRPKQIDLPEQIEDYILVIGKVRMLTHQLEAISEEHKMLLQPMEMIVDMNKSWVGQDDMKLLMQKENLGREIWQLFAGSEQYLKKAIVYSQLWDKEGLDGDKTYHVVSEQIITVIQLGIRYFCWYTHLDETFQAEDKANYREDFEGFMEIFTDHKSKNYFGHLLPQEVFQSFIAELQTIKKALFAYN